MRGKKEVHYFSQNSMIARPKVIKSEKYRITVPDLLQLGVHDELTLEQNLSDAFYNGKIKRKHGKDCFVYELTRKEIARYCFDAEFDYTKLEQFRRKPVTCYVKSVIATSEALDEWYSLAVKNTFANARRELGQTVFYQWPTALPPEAE